LLALITSIGVCVWQYGIKGKRRQLVATTIVIMVVGFCMAISNTHYRERVESILVGKMEGLKDAENGSIEARKELLKESLITAATHPIFGIGPGTFPLVSGWHVAHNAYTELAAESGILALVLFLMSLWAAFGNIRMIQKSERYRDDPEFALLTQALWAGLSAYMTGSCFASIEYNMYAYFVIGYTCAMVRIVEGSRIAPDEQTRPGWRNVRYSGERKLQTAWSR
jgi:O-antigen ligase